MADRAFVGSCGPGGRYEGSTTVREMFSAAAFVLLLIVARSGGHRCRNGSSEPGRERRFHTEQVITGIAQSVDEDTGAIAINGEIFDMTLNGEMASDGRSKGYVCL